MTYSGNNGILQRKQKKKSDRAAEGFLFPRTVESWQSVIKSGLFPIVRILGDQMKITIWYYLANNIGQVELNHTKGGKILY